jgi:hypothetical protein
MVEETYNVLKASNCAGLFSSTVIFSVDSDEPIYLQNKIQRLVRMHR